MNPREIEADMEKIKESGNCRSGFEDGARKQVERSLRVSRLIAELTAEAENPTLAEMENFYTAHRENFRRPGTLRAAHIVRSVNGKQTESEARSAIETAYLELEHGAEFASVAQRYSDCKGSGWDLSEFNVGEMVAQLERAIREIAPGQPTGIFPRRPAFTSPNSIAGLLAVPRFSRTCEATLKKC